MINNLLLSKILGDNVKKVITDPSVAEDDFDENLRDNEVLILYRETPLASYEILSREEIMAKCKKWALSFGMMIRSWENAHGCIAEVCRVGGSDWEELVQPENTEFEVVCKTCEALSELEELELFKSEHLRLEAELNAILHPNGDGSTAPSFCDLVSYVRNDITVKTCEWIDRHDFYEAECGFTFMFTDERESLTDFSFNYCPKCGNRVKSVTRPIDRTVKTQ